MSSSKPPALATWLLEHLAPGGNTEALAGDLLEQFSERPSNAWYWRQVLAAILANFWSRLGSQWVAIGFAVFCTWAVNTLTGSSWFGPRIESAIYWGFRLAWPLSLIYQFGFGMMLYVVIVTVALSTYLAMMRRFVLRRFWRGFLTGLALLFVSYVSLFIGAALHLTFLGWFAHWLPLFCGLLVAMWKALPPAETRQHASTPV